MTAPSPQTRRVEFPGAHGHRLAGRLEQPSGPTTGSALFAHCFTCSKDLKAVREISRRLARRGLAVLRFDFTGLGESEGDFADTDFSSNLDDLVAAAAFLEREVGGPHLLIGHSLGGTAVLAAAGRIETTRAVATIAAPSDTEHLRDLLLTKEPDLAHRETAEVQIGGRPFPITKRLLEDLAQHSVEDAVAQLDHPLLILHSPEDQIVGLDHAHRLFEVARHPKSLIALEGADHLLLEREGDAGWVGDLLAAWAGRHLEPPPEPTDEPSELAPGEVLVKGGPSGLRQEVVSGRHRYVADEPTEDGGDDAGPSPYDLLLAGLGACTGMTLRLYADRKQWPLEAVRVRLQHRRSHADDCQDCDRESRQIDHLERRLELEGELSEDQRQRLREIAERCPVSRTLTTETRVETHLE